MTALTRNGETLIPRLTLALRFHERLFGLMGRRPLGPEEALLLDPCRAIHTWFMRFPLDLIFLDADQRVVRLVRNVKPWRMASGGPRAVSVVELESGWLAPDAVRLGDRLTFSRTDRSVPSTESHRP